MQSRMYDIDVTGYENRTNKLHLFDIESVDEDIVKEGISFFGKKYPEMKYLAYFQAYTNTYDSIDILIEKYEEALHVCDVVGIIIGTRPDCVSDELLSYLSDLAK